MGGLQEFPRRENKRFKTHCDPVLSLDKLCSSFMRWPLVVIDRECSALVRFPRCAQSGLFRERRPFALSSAPRKLKFSWIWLFLRASFCLCIVLFPKRQDEFRLEDR